MKKVFQVFRIGKSTRGWDAFLLRLSPGTPDERTITFDTEDLIDYSISNEYTFPLERAYGNATHLRLTLELVSGDQ